jgi:hypothetical protein
MRRLIGLIVGLVLVGAAVVWRPVVVPKVVKFPAAVNLTTHYQGTFVAFADQRTGLPLAHPLVAPLTIDRVIKGLPSQTGAHTALVQEAVTAHLGNQTVTQSNVYALDRRSMKNVADPKAYTFGPNTVIDRGGTVYLNLPMNTPSRGASYQAWKPETGTAYPLVSASPATLVVGRLNTVNLVGTLPPTPVGAYDETALRAQGLPSSLSAAQVAVVLQSVGINVPQAAAALSRVLSPSEMVTVAAAMNAPVPLQYLQYGSGNIAVDPTSGVIVRFSNVVDGVQARPVLTGLDPALAVLRRHAGDPAVASLLGSLAKLAALPPQHVFEMRYSQTPASVTSMASYARSQDRQIRLASYTIPVGLLGLGIVVLAVDLVFVWRHRHPSAPLGSVEPMVPPAGRKAA